MGLRSDIEGALKDLISNEEGMKFQGLAVVLAKKRWPDLIACERKKDLGADAIAKAPFAAEGEGKVLACSITAKLNKVREDAKSVKKHFKHITKLVFATPAGVSNEMAEAWVADIKKDFDYDLTIMPREDIITSLMDPSNASLLKCHLGIQVNAEEPLAELIEQVKTASADVTAAWATRIAGMPLLELRALRLDPNGRDSTEILQRSDIRAALLQSGRVVLEGAAGRGKTTTLIQLARAHTGAAGTFFLIDLRAWTASRSGILQFIAGMPQFQARSLDAATLARVSTVEHFSFLLNGWNEIGETEYSHAESALRTLERDFPAAGIIVATRTHHIVPPLPGAIRARLLTLTRRERTVYLRARLSGRADELRLKLDGDPLLDDLTRTPFFLSEVTSIYEAGTPIPSTKMGVLGAVTRMVEQSDEHRNHLQQSPLEGRGRDFLGELATRMTAQGDVSISEPDARAAITFIGTLLKNAGQMATSPGPATALGTLCAHHVLDRQDYPAVAFRFEHQQFQEFYAAVGIGKRLFEILPQADEEKKREFTRSYVNEPAWTEPLRLTADDIGGRSAEANRADVIPVGKILVEMALRVDPVFAAELARLCGRHVWKEVRTTVVDRLRSLYASPHEHYRNLALAGMLASGSEDFKDLIEPLLSSPNQQERLGTYRTGDDFHLSSLGPNWSDMVSSWKDEARVAFVSELLHHRNVPEITAFAQTDPSNNVKEAAVQRLTWIGAEEDAARFMASLDANTFERVVANLHSDLIPASVRGQAIAVLQRQCSDATDPILRLRILLKTSELGSATVTEQLKETLGLVTGKIDNYAHVIKSALDIVQATDAPWVSAWIAERVAGGDLWHEAWVKLITIVPEELKDGLIKRLGSEDFKNARFGNLIAVLAASADVAMAEKVFVRLCELRRVINSAPDERHEFEWAVERQLEALLRALPANISVSALSNRFSRAVEGIELNVITGVFSRVARRSEPDLLIECDSELREAFRTYLKSAVSFALQDADYSGELKADLASVLASVGSAADMTEMQDLIRADIERVRRGRAARARGDRGRLGNGGSTSYAMWNIRAVIRLDPLHSDPVLFNLLNEPEYEQSVAEELVLLVAPPRVEQGFIQKVDYERIWDARSGVREEPYKERRKRYSSVLRDRIEAVLKERSSVEQKRPYEFRLRTLAVALAAIDSHGSADLVFEVMSIPDEWSIWPQISAFETLLFNGVALPTDKTLSVLDAGLNRFRKYGIQQQDDWTVTRLLCLLPFVDDPGKGVEKIRQLISELRIRGYHLRGVVEAVGHCRCGGALPFLQELASDKLVVQQLGDVWIDAVAAVDTPESRNILLSFIDPELPGLPAELEFSKRDVASRIIRLIKRDKGVQQRVFQLCENDLPPTKRLLLAEVVGQFGSLEAVSAGLKLIDDGANPPVPYEIGRQLEAAFVEGRPYCASDNTYTLEPRSSNAIRVRLMEMASRDERRKRSALALVARIEQWRLEYGRPTGEPRHPALESGEPWPLLPNGT